MRMGIWALRGGMITRTPECRQPRIAPPRASTKKLTKNLSTGVPGKNHLSQAWGLCGHHKRHISDERSLHTVLRSCFIFWAKDILSREGKREWRLHKRFVNATPECCPVGFWKNRKRPSGHHSRLSENFEAYIWYYAAPKVGINKEQEISFDNAGISSPSSLLLVLPCTRCYTDSYFQAQLSYDIRRLP